MKKILVLSLVAAACSGAQAVELRNNGAAVAGTPAISVIRAGGTLFGAGAQVSASNAVADDFTVGGLGWNVESLSFFSYQTGATAFPFTSATWSVVSGGVNGTVVASGTTAVTSGGLQGYRVTATTLGDTSRGIFRLNADVTDFSLAAGSYWLRWSMVGSTTFSGPWQPPTAAGTVGNAQQSLTGAPFAAVLDAGDGLGIELPFIINGTVVVVPEPATSALMALGALAVLGATRRRARQA